MRGDTLRHILRLIGELIRMGFRWEEIIRTSLPMRLLFSQVKRHTTLILLWLFLFLVVTGNALKEIGASYLFLEPEYLGQSDWRAYFIIGLCMGLFHIAYHLSAYLMDGYRYFIVIWGARPFLRFIFNNGIIPVTFLLVYFFSFYNHVYLQEGVSFFQFWFLWFAFLGGYLIVQVLIILYFTKVNKDIFQIFGEQVVKELQNPRILLQRVRDMMHMHESVSVYLDIDFRWKQVPPNFYLEAKQVVRVLNQNHTNALLLESFLIFLLIILGFFQDYEIVIIPAGGSFLILFSLFLMLLGALSYWFRNISLPWLLFISVAGYYVLTGINWERYTPLYGLKSAETYSYTVSNLEKAFYRRYLNDYRVGLSYLESWKSKQEVSKPKFVMVCVTGGGLRSARWVINSLQYLDSLTGGKLSRRIGFITGASGGMLGATYFRHLVQITRDSTEKQWRYHPIHREIVSADLLNATIFGWIVNVVPFFKVEVDGERYFKGRDWAFERQLAINWGSWIAGYRLKDEKQQVLNGELPLIVFPTTSTADGRQIYFTSLPCSYLTLLPEIDSVYQNELGSIDARLFLPDSLVENIRVTSLLRTAATFPLVLPFTDLPTNPPIELMDAGVYDNYGIHTAIRFLFTYREWFAKNTSGVIIIQIRDSRQVAAITPLKRNLFSRLNYLIQGTYLSFAESRDYINDEVIKYAQTWFKGRFDMIELQYVPAKTYRSASLSFHLTDSEKADIDQALYSKENQKAMGYVKALLNEEIR